MKIHPFQVLVFSLLGVTVAVHVVALLIVRGMDIQLTSPDYYARELRYEDTIQAKRRGHDLQWRLRQENGRFVLDVRTASGQSASLDHASLNLYRPQDADDDQSLALSPENGALVTVPVTLKPGLWKVSIQATGPQGPIIHETLVRQ